MAMPRKIVQLFPLVWLHTAAEKSECCGSIFKPYATCDDGERGTPYCGKGSCDFFGCNCEGGCRTAATPLDDTVSASATPLIQWPMIMTHDAATSYYAKETCTLVKAVANYVMTQVPGSFTSQLECGARAFDLRLKAEGSDLITHHGAVSINKKVSDILNEVVEWASKNPTELVLVYGSHCDGDNCASMFSDALGAAKIPSLACGDIPSLTLGSAMQKGQLPNGGAVLAVYGCVEENYDPSIRCYEEILSKGKPSQNQTHKLQAKGFGPWNCYGDDAQKAFDPFWAYMTKMSDGRGKQQSKLWMTQAHWQTDASSIAQGEVESSCLLKDESKSGVNEKLASKISSGLFPHINLLEVDDVCGGHGPDILKALRSRFSYDVVAPAQDETTII